MPWTQKTLSVDDSVSKPGYLNNTNEAASAEALKEEQDQHAQKVQQGQSGQLDLYDYDDTEDCKIQNTAKQLEADKLLVEKNDVH